MEGSIYARTPWTTRRGGAGEWLILNGTPHALFVSPARVGLVAGLEVGDRVAVDYAISPQTGWHVVAAVTVLARSQDRSRLTHVPCPLRSTSSRRVPRST